MREERREGPDSCFRTRPGARALSSAGSSFLLYSFFNCSFFFLFCFAFLLFYDEKFVNLIYYMFCFALNVFSYQSRVFFNIQNRIIGEE